MKNIFFLFLQWEISNQFMLEGLMAGATMMICSFGFVMLHKLDNHWIAQTHGVFYQTLHFENNNFVASILL